MLNHLYRRVSPPLSPRLYALITNQHTVVVFVVSVEAIFIHKHIFLDHPNVCIRVYYRCLRSVQAGKLASLLELRMHFIGAL